MRRVRERRERSRAGEENGISETAILNLEHHDHDVRAVATDSRKLWRQMAPQMGLLRRVLVLYTGKQGCDQRWHMEDQFVLVSNLIPEARSVLVRRL